MTGLRNGRWRLAPGVGCVAAAVMLCWGCRGPLSYRREADRVAADILKEAQTEYLGKTEPITVERPADNLRRRLFEGQDLQSLEGIPASLYDLSEDAYWDPEKHLDPNAETAPPPPWSGKEPLRITMTEALQIAARNSREFQSRKDSLFRTALRLDLSRDEFRRTFTGMLRNSFTVDSPSGGPDSLGRTTGDLGVSRKFLNGTELTSSILVNMMKGFAGADHGSSWDYTADVSVTIPLLRGSGKLYNTEGLTQAERDLLYAVYEFEDYKRQFAVRIARAYLGVLQQLQEIDNATDNYRRLVVLSRRTRRLADSGELPEFQFDRAIQDELRARNSWINSREAYAASLDGFKVQMGLPPDARVELDRGDLDVIRERALSLLGGTTTVDYSGEIPPADAPVVLVEPSGQEAGPLEMAPAAAIQLALENRLDLQVAAGRLEDARRNVYMVADRLRADVTLGARGSVTDDNGDFRPSDGLYLGLLNIDLPLERTAERNAYRQSLIDLETAIRTYEEREDSAKLSVLDGLRSLRQARESAKIQIESVRLAERRVQNMDLLLQAGRAQIRDVLDAQDSLLSAQNDLNSAMVRYRTTALELQRDLGVLQVGVDGLWQEYTP